MLFGNFGFHIVLLSLFFGFAFDEYSSILVVTTEANGLITLLFEGLCHLQPLLRTSISVFSIQSLLVNIVYGINYKDCSSNDL